ncbi:MAG: hypothetical protein LBT46_03680 [Planctomycetaceae bacterium]|jgi:hypothetical protein|nr:hypothetical protein [Planctomycetaceae bacterium]
MHNFSVCSSRSFYSVFVRLYVPNNIFSFLPAVLLTANAALSMAVLAEKSKKIQGKPAAAEDRSGSMVQICPNTAA